MDMSISSLLALTIKQNASDLHLSAQCIPMVRIDGQLRKLEFKELSSEQIKCVIFSIMTSKQKEQFIENRDIDFGYECSELGRFRVNCFFQSRGYSAVFRVIPNAIPSLDELSLPGVISDFLNSTQGLILVTGPTGSGKSTTLASIMDHINQTKSCHVITIEDPVEFKHLPKMSLIQQRELGRDTLSFHSALKAALREDPDVLLIGEIRDLESIRLALTAAETGHLVLASLHTRSAAKTVDRIVDVFSGEEQTRVRVQLSEVLMGVISQRLYPLDAGGRIGCYEIMLNTAAIGNLIREGRTAQIESAIQSGRHVGMITLEQAKQQLISQGICLKEKTEDPLNYSLY